MLDYIKTNELRLELDKLISHANTCTRIVDDTYAEYHHAVEGEDNVMMLYKYVTLKSIIGQVNSIVAMAKDMVTIIEHDYKNVNNGKN